MAEETVPPFPPKFDAVYFANARYLRVKRALDAALSALFLIVAFPLLLVCVMILRFNGSGPAFVSQVRLGLFGQPYRSWRFRTTADTDGGVGTRRVMRDNPRLTAFGRLLRLTRIELLPQLWNVLRGDMSLVGPKPERPEFIPILEASIPHFRQRTLARPGLTGLAQIFLPPDTGIPSVRKKVQFDLYYIRLAGFWLDLRILFASLLQLLGVSNRLACATALLPSIFEIDQPKPDTRGMIEVPEVREAVAPRLFESPPKITV